jgi:molybdopterin-containing oxidoreductase family iron-sulfur binding subunit
MDSSGIDLPDAQGREYWRSLEELAGTEAFQEFLQREFPSHASEWTNPVTRRRFLQIMGASLALAGLTGCTKSPRQKIVPYRRQPEEIVQGKPLFYATAMTVGGYATGVLVESHMGRPIKVEGNADHPASLGATDAFAQASVLTLYDPDRSRNVRHRGQPSTWTALLEQLSKFRKDSDKGGAADGVHVLTESVTSPTLADQLTRLFGGKNARWHRYQPCNHDSSLEGTALLFGKPRNAVYRLKNADVVVSLDADFLSCGPGHLAHVHDFTARRRVEAKNGITKMNRLYVVEATPTSTGLFAEHRLPLHSHLVGAFATALARELAGMLQGIDREILDGLRRLGERGRSEAVARHEKWAAAVARDLAKTQRGRTLILPGDGQPPAVHALAHLMNFALGNVGENGTVYFTRPVETWPEEEGFRSQSDSLARLIEAMKGGDVKALLILGGNPFYNAPADLDFEQALGKVPFRLHLSLHDDETSRLCHWHIPEAHYLEAWGDARTFDGTASIQQPLIAPLYEGARSVLELLSALEERRDQPGHDLVRRYWRGNRPSRSRASDFEAFWREALHDGKIAGTAFPAEKITLDSGWIDRLDKMLGAVMSNEASTEIVFRADPAVYDGCFANNGWLQELPRPLTMLTWDNAALISPRTAEQLGVRRPHRGRHGGEHGEARADLVQLELPGRTPLVLPAWVVPGHADNSVTIHLGHGRTRSGRVGTGVGFSAYRLRSSKAPWFETGLKLVRANGTYPLASTQQHHDLDGRNLVRAATEKEYKKDSKFAQKAGHDPAHEGSGRIPLSLYADHPYEGYKWGMVIDLSSCVGCSACVVACQAENNIPVVGKEQVMRGREMHWLRIDAYFKGEPDNPRAYFEPVPCMHCENAPCELVCPVEATTHSSEGLNDMVYNRCVGTRYCSNNCPYKVRRFNFLQYSDYATETLKLLHNPDVTVRSRGVMEKCTYCVQRINAARIEAEKRDDRIRDGDVLTACQAACPAGAIVFGDLNDRKSRVAKLHDSPRNYGLLEDLNTRPRTTYLAAIKNPNDDPDLHTTDV